MGVQMVILPKIGYLSPLMPSIMIEPFGKPDSNEKLDFYTPDAKESLPTENDRRNRIRTEGHD